MMSTSSSKKHSDSAIRPLGKIFKPSDELSDSPPMVAHFNRESGTWKGKRMIAGGRGWIRSVLYMSTVVAVRRNPVLKEFYERLRARGKPAKQALTACMRKLLVILNAMVRRQTHWSVPVSFPTLSVHT
jgi:transposase